MRSVLILLVAFPLVVTAACAAGGGGNGGAGGDAGNGGLTGDGGGPSHDGAVGDAGDGGGSQDGASSDGSVGQDGGDAGTIPKCSGMAGAPGTNTRTYRTGLDLASHDVIVHIPENIDPNTPVPLLFVMHGASMSGDIMHRLTGFDDIADREGFAVVYPTGDVGLAPWSVGSGVCGAGNLVHGNGDDIAFVQTMIDDIASDQCIRHDAIFLTGFSMGGYFANHIGCQAGHDMLRGVAPHSGGTYNQIDCPGAPEPVFLIHGTADPLIVPQCGDDAASKWVQRNGCSDTYTTTMVKGGECRRYDGCPADGPLQYCLFDGMVHGWAGAPQTGDLAVYAGGDQYESASELIWAFFAEQLN